MNKEFFMNPKAPTLAITYDAIISSSTTVTFNTASEYIEVTAIDKGVFMKWGAAASSSAFDEFIPANTSKIFIIQAATAQFIEQAATAILVVIEK
jgi:hypothetical protein